MPAAIGRRNSAAMSSGTIAVTPVLATAVRLVAPHRDVADAHAGHVGDRVVLAGRHRSERQAELTGSRARRRRWHGPSLLGRDVLGDADLSSGDARGAADAGGVDRPPPRPPPRRRLLARRPRGRRRGARARRRAPRRARGSRLRDRRPARPRPRPDHRRPRRRVRRLHVAGVSRRGSPKGTSSIPGSPTSCPTCSPPRRSPAGTCRDGARRRSAPRSACTRWTR